jgi:hypothetical protein
VNDCICTGVFNNCALNALLVEHAPHSAYAAEAWDASGTLSDISGNGRHAVLTVKDLNLKDGCALYWQTERKG